MTLSKKELQDVPRELLQANNLVICEWCTGLGKTKAAINCILDLWKQGKREIIIFVPETTLIKNWYDEMTKWDVPQVISSAVTIACYASMHNYKDNLYDLIILDEMHHAGSDLKLGLLDQMYRMSVFRDTKILGLSATIDKTLREEMYSMFYPHSTTRITMDTAIKNGWLNTPKIHLIPLELDTKADVYEVIESRGDSKKRTRVWSYYSAHWRYKKDKQKYPDLELHIRCTAKEKYGLLCNAFEYAKSRALDHPSESARKAWLLAGNNRKKFLGSIKTPYIKKMVEKLSNKRTVFYVSSIEQLTKVDTERAVHSQQSETLNKERIDKFNQGELSSLFAVGKLVEGANLNNIQAVCICQLDGKERLFIQKMGRAMRAEDPEVYILYYPNTRDEYYLSNALAEIDNSYVDVLDIDSL